MDVVSILLFVVAVSDLHIEVVWADLVLRLEFILVDFEELISQFRLMEDDLEKY